MFILRVLCTPAVTNTCTQKQPEIPETTYVLYSNASKESILDQLLWTDPTMALARATSLVNTAWTDTVVVSTVLGIKFDFHNWSSIGPNQSMIDYIVGLWAAILGNIWSLGGSICIKYWCHLFGCNWHKHTTLKWLICNNHRRKIIEWLHDVYTF